MTGSAHSYISTYWRTILQKDQFFGELSHQFFLSAWLASPSYFCCCCSPTVFQKRR